MDASLLKMESIDVEKFSFHSVCLAIQNHDYSRASRMLTQGADVTQRDDLGETLLHKVIHSFDEELLKVLLDTEIDLDAKDTKGQTALHVTCRALGSRGESGAVGAAILLRKGADVSAKDVFGQTPLHLTCSLGNDLGLYHTLMSYGASVDLDTLDLKGRTPLHLAAASSSPKSPHLVLSLLEYGASMDIMDEAGNTPPQAARQNYRALSVFTKYVFVARCANLPFDVDFPFDFGGLDNLKSSCFMEMEIMKGIKFGQHLLRDLFHQWQDPALLEDDQIVGEIEYFFESSFFNDVFFIYGSLLRVAVVKGKGRLVLLRDAQKSFNVLLPNEMKRKILSYTSDKDLVNVIEAGHFR